MTVKQLCGILMFAAGCTGLIFGVPYIIGYQYAKGKDDYTSGKSIGGDCESEWESVARVFLGV